MSRKIGGVIGHGSHDETSADVPRQPNGAAVQWLALSRGLPRPLPGEIVIYKERASAFFGTPLIAHLRKVGADSLIIFGESTSGCVRASTVDAYSYGFHNVVVEECTYDRSMLSHKINITNTPTSCMSTR